MGKKWIWLPDWAFDLSLWEDDLEMVDDEASHVFVPYEMLAEKLGNPYGIAGLKNADVVVGSGLGAFSLLLSHRLKPMNQKWILLSPFADFCDEAGPWNSENLLFKARKMEASFDVVLDAFREVFAGENSDWPEEWEAAARKMSKSTLSTGLRFLVENKLTEKVEDSANMQVVYGLLDNDVPPSVTLRLKEFLPEAVFRSRSKAGHWPPMLLL